MTANEKIEALARQLDEANNLNELLRLRLAGALKGKEKFEALLALLNPTKEWDANEQEYVVRLNPPYPMVALRSQTATVALLEYLEDCKKT
jgi:hypothetical protein